MPGPLPSMTSSSPSGSQQLIHGLTSTGAVPSDRCATGSPSSSARSSPSPDHLDLHLDLDAVRVPVELEQRGVESRCVLVRARVEVEPVEIGRDAADRSVLGLSDQAGAGQAHAGHGHGADSCRAESHVGVPATRLAARRAVAGTRVVGHGRLGDSHHDRRHCNRERPPALHGIQLTPLRGRVRRFWRDLLLRGELADAGRPALAAQGARQAACAVDCWAFSCGSFERPLVPRLRSRSGT